MTSRLASSATVAAIILTTTILSTIGASAQTYEVTKLVPGSAFHGVHGLGIDKSGRLFAGSVAGAALYEVDRANGTAKIAIPSPEGMADDIAFAPDGTMAWTGFLTGDLYARKGDGPIKKLASGLPGINSLAYRKDGRLYATTVFLGDTLYEIDVEGVKPPRQIMEKMGGLNGFEFGSDDMLYGPLWFKGQVAKVDVDKAELTVVADGFKVPAAVNFDSKGNLWVVDTALGQLVRVDPKSGAKKVVAQLKPSLDNLAIDDKDRIFVSNMADNGIQEVDPETGAARQIIIGKLALPGGIGVVSDGDKDTIYVADVFAYRTVDGTTGEVSEPARMHADGVTLEYPMSATAKGNDVLLSSWFTGTVQVIDRKTGKTTEMLHGFKAPHDAIKLSDGTILVNELGSKSLLRVSGEHGKDRQVVVGGLEGPVGMVAGPNDTVYVTEAFSGQVSKIESNGEKSVVAKDLKMPEGIALAPDGMLVVAEVGARRIVQIDPAKGTVTEIAANLPIGLAGAPGGLPTNIPTGVGVGASGTIYFSSDIENAIYKITKK
ncbi:MULTISPECIES: SMP-30/gluconolactonase/LRE family protein [unclassified Bradyrhizobium]|uniref:SMP-30/gluconolactonase/LRE family protein n=1 Tax=unclassified Bradyrhizobium TaxID=2631580 RepID=UPI00143D8DFA|nr:MULTISPECIES: SMP-30/gluconolactonase/LRE family protein [unclassified Bradyrhizobium]